MSFKATLSIDGGEEIRLIHCSYSLNRDVDSIGKPSSMLRGGTVSFQVEATEDSSVFEWLIDQFQTKNGKVTFYKRDSNSKMRELSFENAYVVQYSEAFDSYGENPFTMHFVVSAEKLTIGGASHTNPWPQS